MKRFRIESIIILLLIAIAVITHQQWFNPFSILQSGDWQFRYDEHVKQLFSAWNTWIGFYDLGFYNITLFTFPIRGIIWSFLVSMGFTYDMAVKLSLFIPIALGGFISPYIMIRKFTKNEFISLVSALFYASTTYLLIVSCRHLFIAFIYAFLPLLFFYFNLALSKKKLTYWIGFALLFSIGTFYELRIMYIATFIFLFYFIFFISTNKIENPKLYSKNIFITIVLIILASLFWILPSIFGSSNDIANVANRGLFGNHLFSLPQSFTIFRWSWTGGFENRPFVVQPIQWYLWTIPLIAFTGLLFKNKYRKNILFFGFISIVGIFLTKQSSEPFMGVYLWLYNNFPGFNLFREASKFYIITAFGYLGLLGFGLLSIREKSLQFKYKYIFYAFSSIVIAVSFINLKPFITREIRATFVSSSIPNDYLVLKNFILEQPEYFRTFWIPRDSRWGFFLNNHSKVSNIRVIASNWKNFDEYKKYNKKLPVQERITNILKQSFSNNLFDISSIKYVIIPLQDTENDDDFFIHYGGRENSDIRNWYISQLDKVEWLKKIDIGTEELAIYENKDYKPHIYATREKETVYREIPYEKVKFEQKNPTEYKISLKNISQPTYLNFSESFHPDWKIRAGEFNWFKVLLNKNYFLPDENHFKNDATLNSFLINPDYIKQNYPPEYYKENPDGSIDVELVLYFKLQSYFYLGLIISGTTLLGCVGYLIYDWRKRKKLKVKSS